MVAVALALDSQAFVNLEIHREIDLTGHYASITNTIKLENQGSSSVSKYFHAISKLNYENLSNIRAYLKDEPHNLLKVDVQEKTEDFVILKVLVARGLAPKTAVTLIIEETLAETMTPFPKKIGIFDQQLMLFSDNIYYSSPYPTVYSVTLVKFPSSEIESYTRTTDGNYDLKGKQLTYGPHSSLKPFEVSSFQVHYQNPKAIPYFTRVVREIEVSHWGNIAVSEWYTLVNRGAEVKGEFSRIDLSNRYKPSAINALNKLEAILPRSAWGLYYRDEVGNVSTSHAKQHTSYVHLEISPRFPVMGGWKDTFNIGYNLPTKFFLKQKEDQYALNITFGFPFKEIIAEELIVKIIFPEGVTNIETIMPFDVEKTYFTTVKNILDFTGKPVLVLEKKNAMDFHRKPFQILYTAPASDIIIKPLILSFYVFSALLIMIVCLRVDFSLSKEVKIKSE